RPVRPGFGASPDRPVSLINIIVVGVIIEALLYDIHIHYYQYNYMITILLLITAVIVFGLYAGRLLSLYQILCVSVAISGVFTGLWGLLLYDTGSHNLMGPLFTEFNLLGLIKDFMVVSSVHLLSLIIVFWINRAAKAFKGA
ncbi:MAG: hypothetical protein AB1896_19095, partial [Thermodesulfobacteriota bacterium]